MAHVLSLMFFGLVLVVSVGTIAAMLQGHRAAIARALAGEVRGGLQLAPARHAPRRLRNVMPRSVATQRLRVAA